MFNQLVNILVKKIGLLLQEHTPDILRLFFGLCPYKQHSLDPLGNQFFSLKH